MSASSDPVLLWEPHLLPSVVLIDAASPGFAGIRSHPIEALPNILAQVDDGDAFAVLLDDRHETHRARIGRGAQAAGWAFVIPYDNNLSMRFHALYRLLARLAKPTSGLRPAAPPSLTFYRRHRLALSLRALDGEAEGASRREIGAVLYPEQARSITTHDWKCSGLRKKVARLIRLGHTMRDGDYRHLLTRSFSRIRWN